MMKCNSHSRRGDAVMCVSNGGYFCGEVEGDEVDRKISR